MGYFDQQPHLSDRVRWLRLGLVLDETVKMLREAAFAESNPGTQTWTAQRFLSHENFKDMCGGVVQSPQDEFPLYEQIVGARRDLHCFMQKAEKPDKPILKAIQHKLKFAKRETCVSDGYTSETESLECVANFVGNKSQIACSITRMSLFLHVIRMRLRAPKDVNQNAFLCTMLPSYLLAPVPRKYAHLAGYLHDGTLQDFSFLTLAVLARRTYKHMIMNLEFATETVIQDAKALWSRNWNGGVLLEDRCSDNEDEWEGFEEQMDES